MAVHAQTTCTLSTIPAKTSLLKGHFLFKDGYANVIENVDNSSSNWKNNVHIGANGIQLRYNNIILSEWAAKTITPTGGANIDPNFTFYYPKEDANTGIVSQGVSALKITTGGLALYKDSNESEENRKVAELISTGLVLKKGGIIAGNYNNEPNKFIYLSTEDYGGSPTININGNTSGWRQIIGTKFGVKNDGTLYANNGYFNGRVEATEGYFSSQVTIGYGGTSFSTLETNAKQSQVYNISKNNGTVGYHPIGTLILAGQTDEAQIDIHTGSGQNNTANQNLTIIVNIKRGYNPSISATAGITVRYEGDPTLVNSGSDLCSIIVRCTEIGKMNIYMYTPSWAYAAGWYQVKGRGYTWTNRGDEDILTTAPSEGTAQSITYMNPYTTATNYITNISGQGIWITPSDKKPDNNGDAISTTKGWKISDNIELFVGTSKVLQAGLIDTLPSVKLGVNNNTNVIINNKGLSINSINNLSVGQFGYDSVVGQSGMENGAYFTAGRRKGNEIIGEWSSFLGYDGYASGYSSHAEGSSQALGSWSHAEGYDCTAERSGTHAEGHSTHAEEQYSHAEGDSSHAKGFASHAEGSNTYTENHYAHAEGYRTQALHWASHASGSNTKTSNSFQTVMGLYNDDVSSAYLIVGNGSSSQRTNAFYVKSTGYVSAQKGYQINGEDWFIFDSYSKQITVGQGATSIEMGTLQQHTGYTLRGYINLNGGYTDQWLISYGTYGSKVVAMVYSKYNTSLTQTISCTAVWTKNS